ncbi:SDR family oxidoreductase [Azospirillum rugosum]|uniref:NAD(P)-dependent dehydrogenase (Short-subunit alcohol dehydrogenase family) n=1 Tax=Azospirillum rugosum TaxID=416170 RepID=A0ABS4SWK1_9PROT|nr:SDR family oxidoreductase [Azospirillum rugosum]MBP2296931.1 NAD(P)-dependent dehydrogenase (short-subunit alcohol dehydrogenase family) [Azospirillum rugosum]MDQ0530690.1 NAD(P)-dependent dehydrogenase (short-subunit alcohol dehydrogenase family) [Azospirillum rugosum]
MSEPLKSLIVTGGSRGIGAAVARMAAQRGYAVTFSYVGNAEAAEATVKAITEAGGQAQAVRGDVAREEDVLALFDAAEARFGRAAGLVNNAGIVGPYGRLDEAPAEGIRRMLDINVLGAILCAREAVKRMSTRHGGAGGSIVNLGSIAAVLGAPNEYVAYAASKGAVDSMTVGLSRELARDGIRVNCVRPGLIDTDIQLIPGVGSRLDNPALTPPMGRPGTADEVAESVLWLLSDAASYVTGAILNVSGGR